MTCVCVQDLARLGMTVVTGVPTAEDGSGLRQLVARVGAAAITI